MMRFKSPKDDAQYHWTQHVQHKMMQYGISESLVRRIIRFPKRREEGIAEQTIGVMRPTASKKPQEIWVMYKMGNGATGLMGGLSGRRSIIISTWRYPGTSPVGKQIHIPEDTWEELQKWFNK